MGNPATINGPSVAIAQGDGGDDPFVSTEPRRVYLMGAQTIGKDEAIVRGWMQDLPVFHHNPPEGQSLRALVAFNRVCEATRGPETPPLNLMQVYDALHSVRNVLFAAEELERVGQKCHVMLDRSKHGHITGIALYVEGT